MQRSSDGPAPRLRRDEVRRRLLAAAARVFAEHGIDAATVDDVAAEAGFTRGAVYSNFADKDALLTAMITERVVDRVGESLALVADADPGDDLPTRAGSRLAEHIRDESDSHLLVLEFLTRSARDSRLRGNFAPTRREQRQLVADAVRSYAAADGVELPFPAETYAVVILALVNGLAAEYLADPDDVPLDVLPLAFRALWPS